MIPRRTFSASRIVSSGMFTKGSCPWHWLSMSNVVSDASTTTIHNHILYEAKLPLISAIVINDYSLKGRNNINKNP